MKNQKSKLIVALDVETLEEVGRLVDMLSPAVDIFKVGSQLFTACGPAAVRFVQARGKQVFLDLKYHDIPNTVANAVSAAVILSTDVHRAEKRPAGNKDRPGILMYTVHTLGGKDMMAAAAQAATKTSEKLGVTRPLGLGITVLTSHGLSSSIRGTPFEVNPERSFSFMTREAEGLTSEAKKDNIQNLVLKKARLAKESGLDGVVASAREAALIRREMGSDFVIVTPGIRPVDTQTGDQKRTATPAEAVAAGSQYLVVGRPILEAEDPLAAAKTIITEINSV